MESISHFVILYHDSRFSEVLDKRGFSSACYMFTSGKIREQVARLDGQRLRQLDDILQGDIPFATLDSAYVVPMQTGPFGQFLLGIAPLVAELPQPCAKSRLNGAWGHISMLGG
jgi:hypothetical protein